ncbi:MAG: hypothetical protein KW788_01430 [Candidatus Doudnabacteria bacterium]|nr:hypothetical protein [Candidatus Doudnabacteria bacterium]
MRNIETSNINDLDYQKANINPDIGDQGHAAEEVVMEFFKSIPAIEIRPATTLEDSGKEQIGKDKAIDAIGYLEGKPALGLQITTATDSKIRNQKSNDLLNRPFIRLPEMKTTDTAMPRTLVFIDAAEVKSFLQDHNFDNHPKLKHQIVESNVNSLKLALMKTQNPKEQELINKLMVIFREQLSDNEKGKTH